jgi:hypothetical protein
LKPAVRRRALDSAGATYRSYNCVSYVVIERQADDVKLAGNARKTWRRPFDGPFAILAQAIAFGQDVVWAELRGRIAGGVQLSTLGDGRDLFASFRAQRTLVAGPTLRLQEGKPDPSPGAGYNQEPSIPEYSIRNLGRKQLRKSGMTISVKTLRRRAASRIVLFLAM